MSYAQQQAYNRYKTTAVQTAGRERLLIMLYDGLLQSMQAAMNALETNNITDAHKQLQKSQDIVWELKTTLNMEYEVSHNLMALYDFFTRQLIDANIKKDSSRIGEIYPIVQDLRETWVQAAVLAKGGSADINQG